MSLIILNYIKVQPYIVFGLTLYAVETVGACYDTGDIYQIKYEWFGHPVIAEQYAETIRQGGAE